MSSAKGCSKYGCIGCLTVLAIVVGLIFLFGAIGATVDWGEPSPEQQELVVDLPAVPGVPLPPEAPDPNALLAPQGNDAPALPTLLPPATQRPPDVAPGRIVLDLSMGEFSIVPGPAGEPIRVEADYDTNAFNLQESFSEAEDEEGWTYKLSFSGRGGWMGLLLRGGNSGRNRVKLIVPRDYPIDLVGEIGIGESEIDLGGLWLHEVDLQFGAGEHFIELREPTRYPLQRFRADGSVGNLEIRNLGAASPEAVDIQQKIGELFVDLEGPWQNDAQIDVSFNLGECRLRMPTGVNLDLEQTDISIGESSIDELPDEPIPADAPTLRLALSGSIGELRVER